MKIALINAADKGGGAEHCVLNLHKSLTESGHDCHLFVGYKHSEETNVHEIQRVRSIRGFQRLTRFVEEKCGWQQLYAPGFRHLVNTLDEDFDIVNVHSLWGSSNYADPGALVPLSKRFPTFITLHDEWMLTGHCACTFSCDRWRSGCGKCPDLTVPPAVQRDGTHFNWARKKRILRRSDLRVTVVSDWLRNRVLESPIFEGKEVSVVYNGINMDIFKPGEKLAIRAEMNWPKDRFIVLLAGQTIEGITQGIAQQAVKAINLLDDERILPVLIGHSAEAVAKTLKVPSITLPFQHEPNDLARCFQAADLTLVSSEVETFGRIAAESQACGTPVVAFAAGGLPEVVSDDVTGVIIERFDFVAYANAINELLNDRARLDRMSVQAATWSSSRFANDAIANAYLAEFSRAIDENKVTTV